MQIYNITYGNAINVQIFEDCQTGSAFFNIKMLEEKGTSLNREIRVKIALKSRKAKRLRGFFVNVSVSSSKAKV